MSELHRHNRHSPSHVTHSDGTMLPSQTSHMPIGCDVVTLVEGALPKAKKAETRRPHINWSLWLRCAITQ